MEILFLEYPKCSTCKKAKAWLIENNISFKARHIVEENPTKEELSQWLKRSDLPLKKLFNTSGNVYKELNLKDKLPTMSEDEQLSLLASNGMLVKRPLIIGDNFILAGFKAESWEEKLK